MWSEECGGDVKLNVPRDRSDVWRSFCHSVTTLPYRWSLGGVSRKGLYHGLMISSGVLQERPTGRRKILR